MWTQRARFPDESMPRTRGIDGCRQRREGGGLDPHPEGTGTRQRRKGASPTHREYEGLLSGRHGRQGAAPKKPQQESVGPG